MPGFDGTRLTTSSARLRRERSEVNDKPIACEDCGAKEGDASKVDSECTVNIERHSGRWLCSDCSDALDFAQD